MELLFIPTLLIAIIIGIIIANVRIVPQANAFVIERLGAYHTTWDTGLHVKIPIIDRVAKRKRKRRGEDICRGSGERESVVRYDFIGGVCYGCSENQR